MMDKYTFLQKIGIYSSLALFILFMLLPFVEMFIASLRPLTHLFSRPDVPVGETMTFMDFMSRFYSDKMSFQAYRDMWVTVPQLPRYIFNSVFLSRIRLFVDFPRGFPTIDFVPVIGHTQTRTARHRHATIAIDVIQLIAVVVGVDGWLKKVPHTRGNQCQLIVVGIEHRSHTMSVYGRSRM